jgi:bacillithiol system protein YtxJ
MGLFNKLFNNSSVTNEDTELPWIPLVSISQLDDIKSKSFTKAQLIFKHSTRCGISRMALKHFEKGYNVTEHDFDLYYLDIFSYRDVSNLVSEMFQVYHESPQLLVIKNGILIAHDSHGAINNLDLVKFV